MQTSFDIRPTPMAGLVILTMKQIGDGRGTIRELFRESALSDAGLSGGPWRQINVTETRRGAIRGLHSETVTKLVTVVAGEAFGVYLDLRPDSGTRGTVVTVTIRPGTQVFVPPGVCSGFQAVGTGATQYVYCADQEWTPHLSTMAVHPFDPALAVSWPVAIDPADPAVLSAKDASAPFLSAGHPSITVYGLGTLEVETPGAPLLI